MSISENIRALRIEKGVTQKFVATEIGYSQSVYSDWENGKAEPSASALLKLSVYFGVSADELLDQFEINTTGGMLTAVEKEVIELLHGLTPTERQEVLLLLRQKYGK